MVCECFQTVDWAEQVMAIKVEDVIGIAGPVKNHNHHQRQLCPKS